ncbi:DUF4197 domain-containing protein [Henriciella sp. AS95]|uniref:DUF4197 domain-containing protein n=1 Tax=Henriciella sp. AS95 TaxID=3135782 RepID=UPI00316C6EBD
MRTIMIGALTACLLPAGCASDGTGGQFGTGLGEVLGSYPQSGAAGDLSQFEIDAGLRQALEIGTERVASQIGVRDGYWADPKIRIPLPGRLGEVQRELARVGLSAPLDDLQLRMNRAAEDAVPAGKAIVIDAVKSITIEDAVGLLRGGDTAATDFLRTKTERSLRQLFTPYVENALTSSGAYQALDSATSSVPMLAVAATDYKSSLTTHAVNLGLDGMFDYLALEEKKIRENPVARTTELLRKVFGSV